MKDYVLMSGGKEVATTEAHSVADAESNFSSLIWAYSLTDVKVVEKS